MLSQLGLIMLKQPYAPSGFGASFETTQPKNNQIFNQIKGDVTGNNHNISITP
jgi:hypothetical protein